MKLKNLPVGEEWQRMILRAYENDVAHLEASYKRMVAKGDPRALSERRQATRARWALMAAKQRLARGERF